MIRVPGQVWQNVSNCVPRKSNNLCWQIIMRLPTTSSLSVQISPTKFNGFDRTISGNDRDLYSGIHRLYISNVKIYLKNKKNIQGKIKMRTFAAD